MKRKIYDELVEWKRRDNGSSALLIDGARRVGKSWVAEEFAKAEYKSYVLIDFSKAPKEVKAIFEDDLENLDTFFLKLSTRYGVRLYERDTLFIFDEVQRFPRAVPPAEFRHSTILMRDRLPLAIVPKPSLRFTIRAIRPPRGGLMCRQTIGRRMLLIRLLSA